MKFIFTITSLFLVTVAVCQNVGVGEANPTEGKLQVKTSDSSILLIHSTNNAINAKAGLYYKSDDFYSGGIATVKTASATYRMGLYTYGGADAGSLKERLSISDDGNVGIGNIIPSAKLDVAGSVKIADGTQGSNKVLTSDATGNASWKSLGSQLGYKKWTQYAPVFGGTFSGSFVVPAGVTEIMVEAWGAGSGGTTLSDIGISFGGVSGGYARTVQTVTPGQTCTYTIGTGSSATSATSTTADGGSTTFNVGGSFLTAYGGGGHSGSTIAPGQVRSGTGTVSNLFVLNGNTGVLPSIEYRQKSATVFVEIRKYGGGGVAPAMDNAPAAKGGTVYLENGTQTYVVNDNPSTNGFPSSGGASIFVGTSSPGGNGMIIVWYN